MAEPVLPFRTLGPVSRLEYLTDVLEWLESTGQVTLLGWQLEGDATLDNEPTVVTTIPQRSAWFDSWLRSLIGEVRRELWDEWKSRLSLSDQQEYIRRAHAELAEAVRRWGSD